MKINIVPSKNDKIIYIAKSVRKGNKVKTVNILKCGRLSDLSKIYDDPISHFKMVARDMTEKERVENEPFTIKINPKKKTDLNKQVSFNMGYLFLQKLYYGLNLDKTCKTIAGSDKSEYDLNKILKDLIFSRILYPSSKLSTFDLSKNFIEQPNYQLHDIYRALDVLSENIDTIQAEVYKNSFNICNRNTNVLYYDCTNYFFEIEEQDGFRNYGKSKEHRPNPLVQMGLFIDGNGIPLAFNITPGNTSEQLTPRPTEEMIERDFKLSKFIYCSDAGLGSYSNKWFNQLKNRSFIVTQSLKKLKGHLLTWALQDSDWNSFTAKNDDEVLYKSRPINEKGTILIDGFNCQTTIKQRLIVTYSKKYAEYQRKIRYEQIERAKKIINKPSNFNKHSSSDCKRFIKNISFDKNGVIITSKNLALDLDLAAQESLFDGYYGLVTNLDDNDIEIIKINHNRWEIEESFRIMKLDFKARPVYLQKENRIRAHFLTCYLALLLLRVLEQKINITGVHYTCGEIISTLKEFMVLNIDDICFTPTYTRTALTDHIESILNIHTSFQGLSNVKINKIIKSTKS